MSDKTFNNPLLHLSWFFKNLFFQVVLGFIIVQFVLLYYAHNYNKPVVPLHKWWCIEYSHSYMVIFYMPSNNQTNLKWVKFHHILKQENLKCSEKIQENSKIYNLPSREVYQSSTYILVPSSNVIKL